MLKRTYLAIAFVLFGVSLFLGIDRYFHRHSSHFSFSKARRSNLFSPDWGTPHLSEAEMKNLQQILNQKFVLYDKGSRIYICISEDGNYILKILKYQYLNPKSWLAHFPFSFNPYYQEFLFKKNKCHSVLKSWRTAFLDLQEETGLVYMHINDEQLLHQKVVILDKNVKEHRVDLDKVIFCVQKHADLIYLKIAQLMHEEDIEQAKAVISAIFLLIDRLGKKGAIDENFCADFNLGLIGDEVIQAHISKLHVNPDQENSLLYQQRVDRIMNPFKNWIDQNYPDLSSHFALCLDQLKKVD